MTNAKYITFAHNFDENKKSVTIRFKYEPSQKDIEDIEKEIHKQLQETNYDENEFDKIVVYTMINLGYNSLDIEYVNNNYEILIN